MKLWAVKAVCMVLLITISNFSPLAADTPEEHPNPLGGGAMEFIQATIKRLKRDKPTLLPSPWKRNQQSEAEITNNSRSKKGQKMFKKPDCILKEIRVDVADLGLAYDSEEGVVFRYCIGSCRSAVDMYDQVLKSLIQKGKLINKIRQPCCRPSAYEDVSIFNDDLSTYQILRKFTATQCKCF